MPDAEVEEGGEGDPEQVWNEEVGGGFIELIEALYDDDDKGKEDENGYEAKERVFHAKKRN